MADGHDTYASHSCMSLVLLLFSCYFLTSPLCLRHCSSSIHRILSRRGLKAMYGREYIWIEFVCVRKILFPSLFWCSRSFPFYGCVFVRDKGEHFHNGALAGLLKPLNSRSIHPTWTKSLQFRLVQLYKQQNKTLVTKHVSSLKHPLKILHL